ncbi:MAG: hypothetical protein O2923_10850 [Verrucomicrobia bacterium]|nr:hypothetical protein [Verrucomicrobiota bacterium]MDA1087127.1 hypothetical protein [Verrucomicrobiota bacterium]
MKYLLYIAILLSVVGWPDAVAAEEAVVLTGHFNWEKEGEKTHDLQATFTATGQGKWDVVFNFKWKDKPEEWIGTAEGSLDRGDFKGTADRKPGKHTWHYSGKVDDGVITCEHTQTMRDGKEAIVKTGKFTLSAVLAEKPE